MDIVIGLGNAGCSIADKFSEYEQYKIYKIDTDLKGMKKNGIYNMPWQCSTERYEEKCPSMKAFFKNCSGEVLFVVGGSGDISGCTLRILEQLQHCTVNVMYIRPDISLIPETKKRQEWAVFNILQEYARSAAIDRLWLIDNPSIDNIIGEVPVVGYYDKLNDMIVSSFHMINVHNHNKPVVSTFSEPYETYRVSTLGVSSLDAQEDRLFFPLYKKRDLRYYYAINNDRLEEDGKLFTNIKEQVKNSLSAETKTSYAVFSTSYEHDYVYVCAYTSVIQRQRNSNEIHEELFS